LALGLALGLIGGGYAGGVITQAKHYASKALRKRYITQAIYCASDRVTSPGT
jgi:hypothetical protein